MDKMRDEFEVWACNYNLKIADWGNYADRHVNNMWKAWQASRAALCVQMPRCCNEEQDSYRLNVIDSLDDAGVSYE